MAIIISSAGRSPKMERRHVLIRLGGDGDCERGDVVLICCIDGTNIAEIGRVLGVVTLIP